MSNPFNNPKVRKPAVEPMVVLFVGLAAIAIFYAYRIGRVNGTTLIFFACLIPSIILHEVSHGWLANLYGDRTAKDAGRLTLNPFPHIDLVGTILLPGFLILANTGFVFGYAKPVPVNVSRMSRNKAMFVGLVGPATNIVIALLAALAVHGLFRPATPEYVLNVLLQLGVANVLLAAFNLIPIPPLDGSSVIERFLPDKYWPKYLTVRKYSILILLGLMFVGQDFLYNWIFSPAIDLWLRLLPV